MDDLNFLDNAILDDSEMLEIHGGTSDNITCGSNCGHNCGTNCGNDCGNSCAGNNQTQGPPSPVTKPSGPPSQKG